MTKFGRGLLITIKDDEFTLISTEPVLAELENLRALTSWEESTKTTAWISGIPHDWWNCFLEQANVIEMRNKRVIE